MKYQLRLSTAIGVLGLGAVGPAYAAGGGPPITTSVEPMIGYEHVDKSYPSPHSVNQLYYGVRASAGYYWLALEGEYTRANSTEAFADLGASAAELDETIKLGLRITHRVAPRIDFTVRAGAAAVRTDSVRTLGPTVSEIKTPFAYDPYAGLSFGMHLDRMFSVNLGVNVIFGDFPKMDSNRYQTDVGLTIRFP